MSGVIHRSALAVAVVAALFPGVASAASCADTHLVPAHSNSDRVEAATLCLVTGQRAPPGGPPLPPNAARSRSAAAHSEDMVARNSFDRTSPGGETLLDRIK